MSENIKTFIVKIEMDLTGFLDAIAQTTKQIAEFSKTISLFAEILVEDLFVDSHGIARSDIKKVKQEGKEWFAYLYNGRKIQLDIAKI